MASRHFPSRAANGSVCKKPLRPECTNMVLAARQVGGTGIVEIGNGANTSGAGTGTGINVLPGGTNSSGTGINVLPGGTNSSGTGINVLPGGTNSSGTGINVLPGGANSSGTGINVLPGDTNSSGTGINVVPSGTNSSGTGINVVPSGQGKLVDKSALTGSSGRTVGSTGKGKPKPSTTVVQTLGPDGKMQYKEVPFMGELESNKKAPNITEVKDGEGKVKEYDWIKKGQEIDSLFSRRLCSAAVSSLALFCFGSFLSGAECLHDCFVPRLSSRIRYRRRGQVRWHLCFLLVEFFCR
jgi:hypothetical protein